MFHYLFSDIPNLCPSIRQKDKVQCLTKITWKITFSYILNNLHMHPCGVPTKITVCMYIRTQEFIDGWKQNLIQVLKNSFKKKKVQPFQFSVTLKSFNECYTWCTCFSASNCGIPLTKYLLTAKYILNNKGCKDEWDTHFISSSLFFNHIIFNTNKSKAMHTFWICKILILPKWS
jgi:hypothetical protein